MAEIDIVREAQDELKYERTLAFWRENGRIIIGFVIFTIALTGGLSAYRTWKNHSNTQRTEHVMSLLSAPAFPDNIDAATLEAGKDLNAIVRINAAGALLKSGKTEDAKSAYGAIMNDTSLNENIRDLATITAARLETDGAQQALEKLAAKGKSPFRPIAMMDYAAQKAAEKDYKTAIAVLNDVLALPNLPESMMYRAEGLARVYAAQEPTKGQE